MDKIQIKKVQKAALNILDYFIEICDELNINYILLAGSVLGAVRHHGFIPWDDDIDIGVPRSQYDFLMSVLEKRNYSDSRFFLQDFRSDNKYAYGYAKLLLKNTSIIENGFPKIQSQNGIFIDIFPLDDCPKDGRSRSDEIKFRLLNSEIYRRLFYKTEINEIQKFKSKLVAILFAMISTKKIVSMRRKLVTKYFGKSNYLVNWFTTYEVNREILENKNVVNPVQMKFEGRVVNVPSDWKRYLTELYGDYMKLPPLDKRNNTHLKKVVFEN